MIKSIIYKEWIKLKVYLLSIAILLLIFFVYHANDIDFLFSTVEPESMMWYRFAHLDQKPYFVFSYIFIFLGFVISSVQFLNEKIKNRIKILIHLPMSLNRILFLHVSVGLGFIVVFGMFIMLIEGLLIYNYYTPEISMIMVKDFIFYTIGAIISYLATASIIIEHNYKMLLFKLIVAILTISIFVKQRYYFIDSFWFFVAIVFFYATLDSFYSTKQQRLNLKFYYISVGMVILFVLYMANQSFVQKYQKSITKYYIFYSPIIKKFVYQKNFGDHSFEYGVKNEGTFDRKEYESYLPFVYWRDLDIQKKLPITIDNVEYSKKTIKNSRLSLSYSPEYLLEKEVKLYPLINSNSKIGMIKFPENMLQLTADGIKIYNFDDGYNQELTYELSKLASKEKVAFPIKNFWGKATNLKPYDKGYLAQDSNNNLFNISRMDNKLLIKPIPYPDHIDIEYIKISENKQKKILGYAIDKNSNFYIIDWSFNFIKIELENFDYKNMKLQLISNPLYYIIRYNDENYYASVFTKELIKIDSISFD